MTLYGRLTDVEDGRSNSPRSREKSRQCDRVYNGICDLIDDHIARNVIAGAAIAALRAGVAAGDPVTE